MLDPRPLALPALLLLAACGSGGGGLSSPIAEVPAAVTIADPMAYLVQSRNPDGNAATPLQAADSWSYVRRDFGGYQAAQAFQTGPGSAALIWSYPPFGPFVAGNGDGGETYRIDGGGNVYIASTQDGGKPGVVTQFGDGWWAFDQYVPDCSAGWRNGPDGLGRACHQVITFPGSPAPLTADTIVSEHYALPGQTGPMERAFYAQGWGRVAWMAFNQPGCVQVDPARAPAISAFDTGPGPAKCDERLNTNIVPAEGSMSGDRFGWPAAR
jgi:hypothetical protein